MGKYDAAPTVAAGLIRTGRDRAGLTQSELAEQAGITQQAISAYETGRTEPTLPTLMHILAAAGLELRMHLSPVEGHDESLEAFLESLPPAKRAALARERMERAGAARLRRVRGR
ncbi:MAG TPA: helix-turn-helix transcriptional regulator [Acidimicrobiia bacterium]|nr:helix-turn-helix transcriptional regulator [Acidimicrobiia bacterium]